ncbi:squalene synthetase-like protein [Basidiobolus ranarum]|uniref:Squalene synthetase-like protein n=1 Tax=Basidiobolus ranarum TaxID=34480 RepID=A0ABR2W2Y4_9FUNG
MKKENGSNRKSKVSLKSAYTDNSTREREKRLAQYLAEETGLCFEEVLEFGEEASSNEDISSFEEVEVDALPTHSVQTSPSIDFEDNVVVDFKNTFSDSSEDNEEEELWKKIRELSLVTSKKTSTKGAKNSQSKDSLEGSLVSKPTNSKKKVGKKILPDENARFLSVLNGTFSSTERGSSNWNRTQPKKNQLELEKESTSYNIVNGTFVKHQTQPNMTKDNSHVNKEKKNSSNTSQSLPKQLNWREPDPLIHSDSEESDTPDFRSSLSKNTRETTRNSRSITITKQAPNVKSKNPSQKGKRVEKKEKQKEDDPKWEPFNMYHINGLILQFLKDSSVTSIPLECMDKNKRQAVHLLANAYNLKSKSMGAGDKRYPVLYRTKYTMDPVNPAKIRQILRSANTTPRKAKSPFESTKKERYGKGNAKNQVFTPTKASRVYNPNSPIPPIGSVVGQFAEPIGESNIGHQMLQKMGWSPGEGLSSGRTTPVEAIVRGRSRVGLGGGL